MRTSIRLIPAFLPALLLLAGCAGARRSSSSPEPSVVDHPMHTPMIVSGMMRDQQARAMQDSAIMRVVSTRVDEWNRGSLEGFLALYDQEAELVHDTGFSPAREAVRRMHTERWFRNGGPSARLSARLVRAERAGDQMRRLIVAWTATDAATGREEAWTSELTFRFFPGSGWRVMRELPAREG